MVCVAADLNNKRSGCLGIVFFQEGVMDLFVFEIIKTLGRRGINIKNRGYVNKLHKIIMTESKIIILILIY